MRAHGIGDDYFNMDDSKDDNGNDDRITIASNFLKSLHTNPSRLKSSCVRENRGKEFSSSKSFIEHGKCTLDEINLDVEESFHGSYIEEILPTKRKRSYGEKVSEVINPNGTLSEEEHIAHCLMMLSNGIVKPLSTVDTTDLRASSSKDERRNLHLNIYNQSYKSPTHFNKEILAIPKGLFECKGCKKNFSSHQALGGHRASHKKVKGCFATKLDMVDENQSDKAHSIVTKEELYQKNFEYDHKGNSSKNKEKVHECSLCTRIFSSGQALGGHKRCHWITSTNSPSHPSNSIFYFNSKQFYDQADVDAQHLLKDSDSDTLDMKFHATDSKEKNNKISQEIILLPRDDERHTNSKFSKLIELKNVNSCKTSSSWLQVGLGSTSKADTDP